MQERQYICFQEEKEKKYKDNTEGVYIIKNNIVLPFHVVIIKNWIE